MKKLGCFMNGNSFFFSFVFVYSGCLGSLFRMRRLLPGIITSATIHNSLWVFYVATIWQVENKSLRMVWDLILQQIDIVMEHELLNTLMSHCMNPHNAVVLYHFRNMYMKMKFHFNSNTSKQRWRLLITV